MSLGVTQVLSARLVDADFSAALDIKSSEGFKTYHTLLVLVWSVTIRDPLYSSRSSGAIQRRGIHSLSGVR